MSTLKTEEQTPSGTTAQRTGHLTPRANIFETKDGYVLEAEMPGVNKKGLEVTVENNLLTLAGRRSPASTPAEVVYRESRDLDFKRAFDLDPSIDTAKITAKIENGVVTLTLPKAESVKPRKIAVAD